MKKIESKTAAYICTNELKHYFKDNEITNEYKDIKGY